jgi:flagellar protein FlbT
LPLAINLRPNERLIVNGVVLQNSGSATKLLIHNNASVLREKDIITEADATTPARRIYFAIQCKYLFSAGDAAYLPLIYQSIEEFETAAPSTVGLTREIRANLDQGALYRALKSAKQLIARERQILDGSPRAEAEAGAADR